MSAKRKVVGLLDKILAEADGVDWEWDHSAEYRKIEDERLMSIGRLATYRLRENPNLFEIFIGAKQRQGQPEKKPYQTNDARRAFLLYFAARQIREALDQHEDATFEMPLFQHILFTKALLPTKGLFDKPKARNKMRSSVKRGREIHKIDIYWRSPKLKLSLIHI